MPHSKTKHFVFSIIVFSFLYFSFIIIEYPLIGIKALPINNHMCKVTDVYDFSWANHQNITKDSLIQCKKTVHTMEDRFKIEKIDSLEIINSNKAVKNMEVSYADMPLTFIFYSFFPIIYFLISGVIAVKINIKKRKQNELIVYLLLAMSMSYLSGWVSARDDLYGIFVCTLSLLLIPILLLKYFSKLLHRKEPSKLLRLPKLFIFASVITAIDIFFYEYHLIAQSLSLITFSFLTIYLIVYLILKYKDYQNSVLSIRVKQLVWFIVFSFVPIIFLYAIPNLFLFDPILSGETASLFLLLIPFSLVYVSVSKVFIDIDFILKQLLYNTLLALIIGLLLSFLYIKNSNSSISFFIVTLTSTVLILYLRDYLTPFLHDKRLLELNNSLSRYSKTISHAKSVTSLIDHLEVELKNVLKVTEVQEVLYHSSKQYFCSESSVKLEKFLKLKRIISSRSVKIGDLLHIKQGYALLVAKNSKIYTFVIFSYKRNIMKINKEERKWLNTLALQTNLLAESFMKTNDVLNELESSDSRSQSPAISKLIFTLAEKERTKLAQDIHDTILQDLIALNKRLEIADKNLYKRNEFFTSIQEAVSNQIRIARETCYNLKPPFLNELGLIDCLNILFSKAEETSEFKIDFHFDRYFNLNSLDEDLTINIYRIIQELITNAKKHSHANYIHVRMTMNQDHFNLLYEDDGVGIKSENRNGNHFGLSSIKERVKSINGEYYLNSAPNEGTIIRIKIKTEEIDVHS
ncbi:sensor histidine kinase [Metabacillus halosaccharovorans]|uniref:sensor histidine kinase n=1 Tax=Metabacillus halosaccharovorans TaxID=930124 RepID=UPI0034CD4BC9